LTRDEFAPLTDGARMFRSGLLAAVACLLAVRVWAAPIDLLGSASQQVRDVAAERLRETFVATPRSRWEPVVASLKPGDSRDSVVHALKPYGVVADGSPRLTEGGDSGELYRLDETWVLGAYFGRANELLRTELMELIRHVWVAPASDFTGMWITYFANGRPSHEIHYKDGRYFGTFTSFRADGSPSVVQQYAAEGVVGEEIGYFPSGAVMYRGQYRNQAQSGTWTWYDEGGSVVDTQDFPVSDTAASEPQPEH
jgi:MORN repeat protein